MKPIILICSFIVLAGCGNSPKITLKGASQALSTATGTGVSPSSALIKFKTLWLSTSEDCSNPQKVFDIDNPEAKDLVLNPTIGTGEIPDGTYVCAIIKFSDQITLVPSANTGTYCKAGVSTTIDTYPTGLPVDVCPDGNVTGHGTEYDSKVEDWPCITFTTNGLTNTGRGNGYSPAAAFKLSAPVQINGEKTITLAWDFTNQISDSVSPGATHCAMDPGDLNLQ